MVRVCCYPRCFNQAKRAAVRANQVSFHRIPVQDPYRLRLWLLALRLDLNSPLETLRSLRICSEHFSQDDFKQQPTGRMYLQTTALPNLSLPENKSWSAGNLHSPENKLENETQWPAINRSSTLLTETIVKEECEEFGIQGEEEEGARHALWKEEPQMDLQIKEETEVDGISVLVVCEAGQQETAPQVENMESKKASFKPCTSCSTPLGVATKVCKNCQAKQPRKLKLKKKKAEDHADWASTQLSNWSVCKPSDETNLLNMESRTGTFKPCTSCSTPIGVATKVCRKRQAKQPLKLKLKKKKAEDDANWALTQLRNESLCKLYDETNLLLHKWHEMGVYPLFLLGRKRGSKTAVDCLCPFTFDRPQDHKAKNTMQGIFAGLVDAAGATAPSTTPSSPPASPPSAPPTTSTAPSAPLPTVHPPAKQNNRKRKISQRLYYAQCC